MQNKRMNKSLYRRARYTANNEISSETLRGKITTGEKKA